MDIYSNISVLKGVGPKSMEKLNKCGIFNILDILLYFPRDYEFVDSNVDFENITGEDKQILKCEVVSFGRDIRTKSRKILTTIEFNYNNHKVAGKWFNQPYIKNSFKLGQIYNLMGKFKRIGNTLEVVNPTITCEEALSSEIIPKYPLKGDISNKLLEKLINEILAVMKIKENLPKNIVEKYSLISLDEAIRSIHFPENKEFLDKAIIRLKFQELFTYSMKLLLLKYKIKKNNTGIYFEWAKELNIFKERLPFPLTNAQTKVIRDILRDQKSNYSMNRLIQGDVGSGKTIVALIAIFNVIKNGYQCAFMAPTEILANQHFEEAKKIYKDFDVAIELLTGSTSAKEKQRIKERIKSNETILLIGTHALFQDDVVFSKLGLIVTDEQHRFGVEQRSKLINKGKRADCLVMTATPIPRTLALYLYSDLDVSIIDELPPGRKKIDTRFYLESKKDIAYDLAYDEVKKGRQVYIVCPLIDEDEKEVLNSVETVYNDLTTGVFKDFNVKILHGKMKSSEKDKIIKKFKNNEIDVLISTTVIEVGVNVPNASVMIVENAERFGLSQLHQLRGRVGRGEYSSYCILIANAKSNVTKKRMQIMTESSDGFLISEKDLELRGAGEMFGKKQSGDEGFVLADLYEDMKILRCAKLEANSIIQNESGINSEIITELSKNLEKTSKYICFN
ncbi:ATP-dependent DNA helicase RecG [Clostridium saccharoperbutylacetonicum]|uniref:ATP-dependent DNA helicase RecG n=1 Tax=Clostridium saccharoperbutylacetonicum N1-4(HMT) TaxID=931276 RepID=M1MU39_9CLOT|nr:ATP-dependent DNA helicase RecG [Clostridium saccharoperbutylacetonicum]AGF55067.1 ATP-dependent DNA helicase RecG [Clostridium saccharoperbutylacetonicum N1-4(HMT)]AQR93956.1 ATP-dependent DNA helicase RecG [Clostridium saccharoperbutylacetonicum]NRT64224.1 ATP-dependent DNA helicase RecG [Clostridium saccharoperbutylacetonicum]NSB27591.1 ATP-dependent DNA helicase RecG [Clostridium saccharoperbutylacetonicum]NSB29655.1 ATP-dependent DNA helicase RecG [Clostridium saccharoperbutylacetonicu